MAIAPLLRVLRRLSLLLAASTLLRVLFFVINLSAFQSVSRGEICLAFFTGLRFDLSYLLLVNIPFFLAAILMSFFPHSSSTLRKIAGRTEFALFSVVNIILLLTNIPDAEYFKLSGRRSSLGLLAMGGDIRAQAGQLLLHYWHVPVLMGVLGGMTAWLLVRSQRHTKERTLPAKTCVFVWLALLPLIVCGIRGGWQRKPLSPAHAYIFSTNALGALALNTPFHLVHTSAQRPLERIHDLSDSEVNRTLFLGEQANKSSLAPASRWNLAESKPNVVIFIMESFGREYLGGAGRPNYLPFVSELAKKSLYFENGFANGRRSIEAVSSIAAGIPSLMDDPYVTSPFQGNEIHGLGSILKEHGYETFFFHGGKNGTMFFDTMSRLAGFEHYVGMSEYPQQRDYDGTWGIFDEPFFQFVAKNFDTQKRPFAAVIFSLSSHNPYAIPKEFQNRFPKGTLPIHESLGYADEALRRFFASASQRPWHQNTIYVVTGDHTSYSDTPQFQTDLGAFRVPILFYHPGGKIAPLHSLRPVQHADILPSLLELLGQTPATLGFTPLPFGQSVFRTHQPGMVLNHTGGEDWLLQDNRFVKRQAGGQLEVKGVENDCLRTVSPEIDDSHKNALQQKLKALLQFYNNGLLDNAWYRTLPQSAAAPQSQP